MNIGKTHEKKSQSQSFGPAQQKPIKSTVQTRQASTLSKEFFTQLLKLETQFYSKTYNTDTLNNLTQYYAKAVEYYDHIKDDIASYFIFKIQDILATKKSLTMLSRSQKGIEEKENVPVSPGDNFRSSEKAKPSSHMKKLENDILEENTESEDEEEDEDEKPGKRRRGSIQDADSIARMRNQKKRFVNFFYKMEGEIANQKENMVVMLKEFNELKSQNDQSIQDNLMRQKQRIREKMEKRKEETFIPRSFNQNNSQHLSFSMNQNPNTSLNLTMKMSMSMSYRETYEKRDKNSNSNLEFVLKELDLVDAKEVLVRPDPSFEVETRFLEDSKGKIYGKTWESLKESKETKSGDSSDNEKISTERDTDSEKGSIGDN